MGANNKTPQMSAQAYNALHKRPKASATTTQTSGNLYPAIRAEYYVAIDPGVNTGFALWHARKNNQPGRFLEVTTLTFWSTIQRLDKLVKEFGASSLRVRIEDVRANRPTFREREGTVAVREKMSQNIGSNKRDCQLLIQYIESRCIPYDAIPPKQKAAGAGKITAAYFAGIIGFPTRSSQHARDAAYLVANL